jgi:hypothetical protein
VNNTVRPFANTPGRDTSKDRVPPCDVARHFYDQRQRIADDLPVLRQLIAAVDWPNDLAPGQWAQWYGLALGFEPDLIVELGRGRGNSTALFTQAANRLPRTRVVSICRSHDWSSIVGPRVARVVQPGWFDRLDVRRIDIFAADYKEIIGDASRVLMLWDAHGLPIAELVLGEILPRLLERQHLILMHDISDNRYCSLPRSYCGLPLWRGSHLRSEAGADGTRLNIGWMNSREDQVIALADFATRNDLEIGSGDHELASFFGARPGAAEEMRDTLGDEFFRTTADWAFLSLNDMPGPFHTPALSGWRAAGNRAAIVAEGLSLPAKVVTEPVPWRYSSIFSWRPTAEPPAGAAAWVCCRMRAIGGAAGIGLLSSDEKEFVESQVVLSHSTVIAALKVPDVSRHGRLVIHTWDMPEAANVCLEDLSLVW